MGVLPQPLIYITLGRVMATLLDWSQVNKKVSCFQETMGLEKKSDAFIYYCLSRILKIDPDDIDSCVTDGQFDRGIRFLILSSVFHHSASRS